MLLSVIALLAALADAAWIGENLPDGVKAVSEKNCPVFRRAFDLESDPANTASRLLVASCWATS